MDGLMAKLGGAEVLRKAVSGMLPKNRLRDDRLARLKAFEGENHPYEGNIVRFAGRPQIAEWPPAEEREGALAICRLRASSICNSCIIGSDNSGTRGGVKNM